VVDIEQYRDKINKYNIHNAKKIRIDENFLFLNGD
jgi:hypothetical protein